MLWGRLDQFLRGLLVRSSVAWSLTPVQLFCNSHYTNEHFATTLQLKLVPVCSDFTTSWPQFAAGELVVSSQLLRNCFAASWQPPHLHISFAHEILFVATSPWPRFNIYNSLFFTWDILDHITKHPTIWCLLVLWRFHLAVPDTEMTCRDLT